MLSCSVADADRCAASVAVQMVKLALRDVSLAAYGEHDRKCVVCPLVALQPLFDEVHLRLRFDPEAHAQEGIDGEAAILNMNICSPNLTPPKASGSEHVGAATVTPLGSNVSILRVSRLRCVLSRRRPW